MSSISKNTLFAQIGPDYYIVNEQSETLLYNGQDADILQDQEDEYYIIVYGQTKYIEDFYRTGKEWNKTVHP